MGAGEQIEVAVARIEERLEHLLKTAEDSASRIKILEEFKWKLLGAATVIGSVSGVLGKFLAQMFL